MQIVGITGFRGLWALEWACHLRVTNLQLWTLEWAWHICVINLRCVLGYEI